MKKLAPALALATAASGCGLLEPTTLSLVNVSGRTAVAVQFGYAVSVRPAVVRYGDNLLPSPLRPGQSVLIDADNGCKVLAVSYANERPHLRTTTRRVCLKRGHNEVVL